LKDRSGYIYGTGSRTRTRLLGAEVVGIRSGPPWMSDRGWSELDWRITREQWGRRAAIWQLRAVKNKL
jgi:hypothetical protein